MRISDWSSDVCSSDLQAAQEVARRHGVTVDVKDVQYFPPTPFDADLVGKIRNGAAARELPRMDIVTGAGHDAVYMAAVAPPAIDRKSVGEGKRVAVRLDLGGRRIIKKKTHKNV